MSDFSLENTYPKLKTGRICLIDADYVKYIVCSKIYKDIQRNEIEGKIDVFIKEEPAISYTKDWLSDWLMKIDDPIIFCFSGKSYNTFRSYVAFEKEYKGNRKKDYTEYEGKLKDMTMVMQYIRDNFISLLFEDLEADDIVSFLQDKENTYIVSNDKDIKQIPGYHYNFQTNNIYEITNEQAIYNLAYQLIIGDTTDNISGLPKFGEKKAIDFLRELKPSQYILGVLKLYQKNYGIFKGTDMFNESWNLIKLRENRGNEFVKKYKLAFDTKEMLLLELKKQKLKGS